LATQSDTKIAPTGQHAVRPTRRRFWLRRLGVVLALFVLWLTWSVGGALTAPGADTTSARLAEWARFHGLGTVVSAMEKVQYQLNPPKIGGALAGGIPTGSAAQAAPVAAAGSSGVKAAAPSVKAAAPTVHAALAPIPPQVQPSLPNEGTWQTLVTLKGQPAIQAAFLRPDAQHTSYLVGVASLDQKLVKMVLHPGFQVPGGTGWSQPSDVPTSERDSLLATFNSGFTMADANGGYWQDGKTGVPLRTGAASMVLYTDGHVDVVSWNGRQPGTDVSAVRQNLNLLVDNGAIVPDVASATTNSWGKTVGNATYVWRTAVGIRADGSLVFVVGNSLSVQTLANIVHDAGAVRAMELDINKAWTNFMTYSHPSPGVATPQMLTSDEQPNPTRYLQQSSRDFVAVFPR
jgi:hypothetical protein